MIEMINPGRRAFFRGATRLPSPVRPPWTDDAGFGEGCTRCGDCLAACPEAILVPGDGGFPEVDFSRGACTFCGDCATSCGEGLFDRSTRPAWRHVAVIGDACLARRGVVCQSCKDACDEPAITLAYGSGRAPMPEIDAAACTGCGACIAVCPADAIAMTGTAQ